MRLMKSLREKQFDIGRELFLVNYIGWIIPSRNDTIPLLNFSTLNTIFKLSFLRLFNVFL